MSGAWRVAEACALVRPRTAAVVRGLCSALRWAIRWAFSPAIALALAGPALAADPALVGLYRSASTNNYFLSVSGRYDALLGPWRQTLAQLGVLARELQSESELRNFDGGVLIVPSAVALSDNERRLLKQFKAQGGSLLVTWAIGVRDAEGRWLGHGFARELLGVTVAAEVPANSDLRFLIPFGDSPLNRTVPAGQRIWLSDAADRPLQLQGGQQAAVYTDWSRMVRKREPLPSAIAFDEDPAISKNRPGGRWVMFGYTETHWGSQRDYLDDLTAGALEWLQRGSAPYLAAWPRGRRAAQIIEMDTEDGFGHAIHFAELMEQLNAKATFYCLTSEARKHSKLVQDLAKRHEISFHGEVHYGFKRLPREIQRKRLARMMDEMRLVLGADATGWPAGAGRGFRAPTESYDTNTEELLLEFGFEHHAADPNRSESRLPFFYRAGSKSPSPSAGLLILPRGQADDLNYQGLKMNAAQVGDALIGEYELNLRMGGLALLSVHSQNFVDTDKISLKPNHGSLMTEALETLVKHVGDRHDKVWMTAAGEVTQWWRARSNTLLEVTRKDGSALEVKWTITGEQAVDGLTLLLPHRTADTKPRWRWQSRTSTAAALQQTSRLSSALVLGPLAPGSHSMLINDL